MKKIVPYLIIAIIIVAIFILLPKKAQGPESAEKKTESKDTTINNSNKKEESVNNLSFPGVLADSKINGKVAVINTDKGEIKIELYGDKAPKSVSNFVYLTENKYYDGLTFHRVVPGFVIQGGDPNGNGTGGPGYKFEDEPVVGEYLAGTVAMANAGTDTNGSQFFICLEDLPSLPKQYNLFGQVISGMDVVKNIAIGDKMKTITIIGK